MRRRAVPRVLAWLTIGFAAAAQSVSAAEPLTSFGAVTMNPALNLNGAGSNVDSIAFWEAPNPEETLMFVTGKSNNVVEVWRFPFQNQELAAIPFSANVNGVVVDQESDRLHVSDRVVSVFSLPDRQLRHAFGQGIIGAGENNLDLLRHSSGQAWLYVSDDHNIHRFNAATSEWLGSFAPAVSTIETVLADDFHQLILVPEEQGPEGNPGVFAYHPDGTPFLRNGSNRFGHNGEFDSDEEGILLYSFPAHGARDNGTGFIVVTDQRDDITDFEFFDRTTWAHLGKLRLQGVSNTDGIASTQRALPGYPLGVFAAIDNDTSTAIVGWDAIFAAIGWDLAPEAVQIIPVAPELNPATGLAFTVVFSEPVTGFDEVSDLVITHQGTAGTGAVISGAGTTYTVTLLGLSGTGSLSLAVNTAGNVLDSTAKPLASSVSSATVAIEAPYHAWAIRRGLSAGQNDGPEDDPDSDGLGNLAEFASAGNPLSGTADVRDRRALVDIGGARYFAWMIPVRNGAVFSGSGPVTASIDGVVYSVSASRTLVNFDETIVEMSPGLETGLPALEPGWSYRTFRMTKPASEAQQGFFRLSVVPSAP